MYCAAALSTTIVTTAVALTATTTTRITGTTILGSVAPVLKRMSKIIFGRIFFLNMRKKVCLCFNPDSVPASSGYNLTFRTNYKPVFSGLVKILNNRKRYF